MTDWENIKFEFPKIMIDPKMPKDELIFFSITGPPNDRKLQVARIFNIGEEKKN